jgi:high-affinity iron transporter
MRIFPLQKKWELKLAKEMANINDSKGVDGDKEGDKTKGHVYTVFSLSFSAVFREGVESVVFLAGIGANTEATAIPIPGLLGVVLGIITGLLVFRGSVFENHSLGIYCTP